MASYKVAVDHWPQIVSEQGQPLKVAEHKRGDVVEIPEGQEDRVAHLVKAGALVDPSADLEDKAGKPLPADVVEPDPDPSEAEQAEGASAKRRSRSRK